ncbi:hypothetical protein [Lysinibacillus fusiformis]|uniref:hypothetical protein n=1 Tax=Lysinibacillus fusiformis TaxID=28031 RepID=UPI0034E2343A
MDGKNENLEHGNFDCDEYSFGGIKKRPHDIRIGNLNIAVIWFFDAEVEQDRRILIPSPPRIVRELNAANSIWRTSDGVRKVKVNMVYSNYNDSNQIYTETLDEKGLEKLVRIGKGYYKAADVYVFYLPGISIMGSDAIGRALYRVIDNELTYIVIMSNGARDRVESTERKGSDYVLAHELGHIMYYTNHYGWKQDPKPNDDTLKSDGTPDIGHHDDDTEEERRNLMSPSITSGVIPTITDEQVIRALQSRFFIPGNPGPRN